MELDRDLLMFTAVDKTGRARPGLATAVLSGGCARSLVGPHRPAVGALLEPAQVLAALDDHVPRTREARNEYSAILRLAMVAEASGLVLHCGPGNGTAWTPADEPEYWNGEVQTALRVVAAQLGCTVEQAAHRLFALESTVATSLLDTSRDVVAGRVTFVGTHDASIARGRAAGR